MTYKPGDQVSYKGETYIAKRPDCSPSRVKAYMGLRLPRCGCDACWKKYHSTAARKLRAKRDYKI